MNTFTYINHDTWLEDRNKGIGASDIPILCNESNFMTPLDLWDQKINNTQKEIDDDLQKLFDAGHDQEPITLYRYLKNQDESLCNHFIHHYYNKNHIDERSQFKIFTEFHHPNYNFMFAHPDMIHNNTNIEVKFVRHKGDEWNFNDLTQDGIPFKYYLQTQFQMMCTGLNKTIILVNYAGVDFYEFEIFANEELFRKFEKICSDFWKLVENKEPPMPSNRADVRKLFPNRNFKALSLTGDMELQTILQKDRYAYLTKRRKQMKKEQEAIKTSVLSLMVNNNVLQTAEGDQIASITEFPVERIMALKKIKSDHVDVYNYLQKNEMINTTETMRLNF